jgi:hypothetical protein
VSQLAPAITTATGTLKKTYRQGGSMPSKTPEQARLMHAVAHGWKPDRIKGPPVSVAKEFTEADKEVGHLKSAVKKRSAKIRRRRGGE